VPQFWKQFFEASANVSLSGYEELANDDESTVMEESTAMRDETSADYTRTHDEDDMTATPGSRDVTMHGDESLLDDAELSGSTPRPPATRTVKADISSHSSPFDSLKREDEGTTVLHDEEDSTVLFAQRTAQLPDMSMTPRGMREDYAGQPSSARRGKDPLLHRVLDKNYRVQATPHRPGAKLSPLKRDSARKKGKEKEKQRAAWQDDDSFLSSPEIAAPTLRSEVFMSPYKLMARQRAPAQGPRTPGVSVQTPATAKKSRDAFTSAASGASVEEKRGRQKYEIDWESDEDGDDDLYAGLSPPKTIQFALPPSKLLQTPGEYCGAP
jgi:DASH complex subunit ASK1